MFYDRVNSMNSCVKLEKNITKIKKCLKQNPDNLNIFGVELQNLWYDLNVDTDAKQINILLLRSPVNWFSSFISHQKRTNREKYLFAQMWKMYAHEFIGKTNYLKNKINIYYDTWVTDETYRKKIYKKFKKLGFNFDYKNTNFISSYGNGSSFTGTKLTGEQLSCDVLDRIKFLKGAELKHVKQMMLDDEIKHLQEEIKLI